MIFLQGIKIIKYIKYLLLIWHGYVKLEHMCNLQYLLI